VALQGAALQGAALQGAALQGVALQGVALQGAALQGAALQGAASVLPAAGSASGGLVLAVTCTKYIRDLADGGERLRGAEDRG
jgi:pentapeptide repeat protein